MNGRLYDPVLGRMLSPDNYIQAPGFTQNFNRYSYVLNNPLNNTDPDGEFIVPMLMGAAMGIIMGGTTYSIGAAINGNWDWNAFGKSVGFGAVGGAISGGFSALAPSLGAFGNTLGYNMLSQTSSSIMTSAIFGNQITAGDLVGSVAAGLVGSKLPGFRGVSGGTFKNGIAELGQSTIRGAYLGYISGSIAGMIDNKPDKAMQGMIGGAISGASGALTRLGLMGAVKTSFTAERSHYIAALDAKMGATKRLSLDGHEPVYRTGGLFNLIGKGGMTLGRNLFVPRKSQDHKTRLYVHERVHYYQQQELGWAKFYARTVSEYIRYGHGAWDWNSHYHIGTLEWSAEHYVIGFGLPSVFTSKHYPPF